MFILDSEAALVAAFRPKDRGSLEAPRDAKYPLFVRDYLSWRQPAGAYAYLVFAVPGGAPTGIVFQTNGGAGEGVAQMCDWCHSSGVGAQVALLTATVTGKKRAGVHVCSDLSCKQKLEDEANRTGLSVLPAIEKLLQRMGRFASEALKIELSGAGR